MIRQLLMLGLSAGSIAFSSDGARAQTARPLLGTLTVNVPRGLLPNQDYWLYVNGQIVAAPPYGPFAEPYGGLMHVTTNGADEYWDANGLAVRIQGGRATFLRAGVAREAISEGRSIQLAPGKYVVELLVRADHPFPFAIARTEAQVSAGKIVETEIGVPAGATKVYVARAARCGVCAASGFPPQKTLEFIQSDLAAAVRDYEADPIVPVLNQVLLNLSVTPPSRSSVFANLPDSLGGGRELDARQVSLMVGQLEREYAMSSIDGNTALRTAADPIPQFAEQLGLQITRHNKRIDNFRQIVKLLEQAKRP